MAGYVIFFAFAGCDRHDGGGKPFDLVSTATPTVTVSEALSLRPDRRTILRAFDAGSVLVGQPGGEDAGPVTPLKLLLPDGTARRAPFDGRAIAAALNVPEKDVFLRDALPIGGGRCLVFVNGFSGPRALLGVWLYRPGESSLVPIAGAERLGQISGLGDSAMLADGRLIAGDRGAWLWLSGFGQSAVIWIGFGNGTDAAAELRRVEHRLVDDSGLPIGLGDASLWRTEDNAVLWVRPGGTTAYRISLENFTATDRPGGLPPIVVRDPLGRRTSWQFTPAPEKPKTQAEALAVEATRYPLLTVTPVPDAPKPAPPAADADTDPTGPRPTVYDRDALRTRLAFPRYAMRFTQWCPDPTPGRALAYDAMSGEVLRLKAE
ncbi:MAG: hypothetical protein QM754_01290 [Tepidisphaeraceae bacterium]